MNLTTAFSKSKKLIYTIAAILISIQFSYAQFWELIETPAGFSVKDVFVASNGYVFIGGADLYRSVDNCETWELNSDVAGYSFTESSDNIIVSGTFYKTDDFGETWKNLPDDIGGGKVFFSSNNTLFVTTFDYDIQCKVIAKTVNLGETWDYVLEVAEGMATTTFDFAEASNEYLYMPVWRHTVDSNGVYRSIDGGDNWEFIYISDIGFTSVAVNSNDEIFAASFYDGLFKSADYGETWTHIPEYKINDIFIDPNDVIYVASDYGVYRSFNNGTDWEDISSGLLSV